LAWFTAIDREESKEKTINHVALKKTTKACTGCC